jgi:hypothetical protein
MQFIKVGKSSRRVEPKLYIQLMENHSLSKSLKGRKAPLPPLGRDRLRRGDARALGQTSFSFLKGVLSEWSQVNRNVGLQIYLLLVTSKAKEL